MTFLRVLVQCRPAQAVAPKGGNGVRQTVVGLRLFGLGDQHPRRWNLTYAGALPVLSGRDARVVRDLAT